jgi:hypothetical protein
LIGLRGGEGGACGRGEGIGVRSSDGGSGASRGGGYGICCESSSNCICLPR